MKPHVNISEIGKTDLVLIPSLNHNYDLALTGNDPLVDWVEKQYLQGAEVATICTGVYILSARGLLYGKKC